MIIIRRDDFVIRRRRLKMYLESEVDDAWVFEDENEVAKDHVVDMNLKLGYEGPVM